jgi:hypothetical protein
MPGPLIWSGSNTAFNSGQIGCRVGGIGLNSAGSRLRNLRSPDQLLPGSLEGGGGFTGRTGALIDPVPTPFV